MRHLSMLVLLVLCSALTVGAAPADREVVVTPVGELQADINSQGSTGVCVFGNDNPAAFAITDWIWGQESYKTLFYADPALCSVCTEGFTVESVTMYMNFKVEDVPITFDAMVDFEEAVPGQEAGCQVPGPAICTSPTYSITIDTAGLYAVSLPMTDICACAELGHWYGVGITFPNAFPETQRPDAVTDESPLGCVSYNDYGSGWLDAVTDFGFPGELIMYADIVCCSNPVPVDGATWGSIKSMFR